MAFVRAVALSLLFFAGLVDPIASIQEVSYIRPEYSISCPEGKTAFHIAAYRARKLNEEEISRYPQAKFRNDTFMLQMDCKANNAGNTKASRMTRMFVTKEMPGAAVLRGNLTVRENGEFVTELRS
jgi:hypothetical protein